jgi:tRNA (cmo5U34)-methyltransferase
MMPNVDNHTPHENGRWSFDASVTENFDAMLKQSIPDYMNMRELTFNIGRNFVNATGGIVDLGASRGEALAPFVMLKHGTDDSEQNLCYALEISDPMLAVLRERFADCRHVSVLKKDLRQIDDSFTPFLRGRNCLILSVLTLQFVPIEYRAKILRKCYNSLQPGGALIFVEKVLGNTADIDELFVDEYYKLKNGNGYSYEDIQRKKAALEGVMVPMTDSWNREMLRNAGFSQIDCFFRNLNFCGIIAIKD